MQHGRASDERRRGTDRGHAVAERAAAARVPRPARRPRALDGAAVSPRRTVLVVDDEGDIREILRLALEDEGYGVETARDGHEALDKVRRDPPSAVLLDLMMPIMDGWCFLAARSTLSAKFQCPVLVMSAVGGRYMARQLGARDFIAKPFDLDALLGKVAALC